MQLTFLLSVVNGILDVKLIESGAFVPTLELFNPVAVLQFIITIFRPMIDLQRTELVYETVKAADLDREFSHNYNKMMMTHKSLPLYLVGD